MAKAISKRLPKVKLMAVCDAYSPDPTDRKITLYGVFETLAVKSLPATLRPFSFYSKLDRGLGKFRLSMEVVCPDGKVIAAEPSDPAPVDFEGGDSVDFFGNVSAMGVDKSGEYVFYVKADKVRLEPGYPVSVIDRSQSKSKPGTPAKGKR